MLREEMLKENIDGEALIWAHNRIVSRARAAQDPDGYFRRSAGRQLDATYRTRVTTLQSI